MELPSDLVPSDYATAPRGLDVASTLALGYRLISVAPANLPAHAVVSRDLLSSAITLLGQTYGAMQADGPAPSKRPIDARTDVTWGNTKSRIDPWTTLEDSDHPDVGPARELKNKLFPADSMVFITLDYNAQWAEANWRIDMLQREQLLPLLRRLIGDLFVDQLLLWHERYTAMIGVSLQGKTAPPKKPKAGKAKAKKSSADAQVDSKDAAADLAASLSVGELRRRAQQAIVGWQLTLVTLHLSGHQGARAALRPTDEFRERAMAGSRTPAAPEPSDPPAADAPPAPAAVPDATKSPA